MTKKFVWDFKSQCWWRRDLLRGTACSARRI